MGLKPGYKQTEVGVIPEEWHTRKIREIAEVRGRVGWKGYTKKDLVPLGPFAIGAKHIDKECGLDLSEPTYLSRAKYLESPEIMVQTGDILVVQRGTIGKLVLIEENIGEATINPSLVIVRTTNSSPSFIRYFLLSSQGQKQIILDTSTTGVPMISQRQIENFRIPFPPTVEEQRAIARALSDVDALIGALDQLIAKKRDLKQAAMQQLLTGQKRLPGFHGEWEVKRLDNFAPLQRGFDLPTSQIRKGDYPVVYSNGVQNYHAKFMVKGPGVVTGRSGTIGNVHFVEQDFWPHNTALWVTDFKCNHPKFVFYLLTSIGLERFATGSGVPTLNRNDVHEFPVSLPTSSAEQTAIAGVLSDMDAELAALEQRRDKTRALKQGMMQELLTGKTRLPVAL